MLSTPAFLCSPRRFGWISSQMPNASWTFGKQTGCRMKKGEDGVVPMQEIERCVRLTMEDGGEFAEVRKNSLKWKESAKRDMMPDGFSDASLSHFTQELVAMHIN
ncbi:hypothetical protein SUGI_0004010 [Cryptomeria japonica]|nr:hypothetical protein SUGI_0004010 [Cryptomeria japonica]